MVKKKKYRKYIAKKKESKINKLDTFLLLNCIFYLLRQNIHVRLNIIRKNRKPLTSHYNLFP